MKCSCINLTPPYGFGGDGCNSPGRFVSMPAATTREYTCGATWQSGHNLASSPFLRSCIVSGNCQHGAARFASSRWQLSATEWLCTPKVTGIAIMQTVANQSLADMCRSTIISTLKPFTGALEIQTIPGRESCPHHALNTRDFLVRGGRGRGRLAVHALASESGLDSEPTSFRRRLAPALPLHCFQ